FAIDGEADSRRVALRLVDEANVGVAPGTAFGDDHGFLRLCFSRRTEDLEKAADRLADWIKRAPPGGS
ncbi:MAG: aspartate aminotransferase, partial [Hyphomicrobiales bacterium]|nr:aspartate aminotransferase [Hyphomicrobiales bacterium]